MSDPLVSVIIPCFNVEGCILRALSSLQTQSYNNLEIICVDDGSSDRSAEIIYQWKIEHPTMNLMLVTQKNSGAPSARNAGLSLARGLYLQFLDADDELLPEKIKHQVYLAVRDDLDIVIGGYLIKDEEDRNLFKKTPYLQDPFLALMRTRMGITSANLFSKSVLEKAGGWNENLKSSQEYDLMFRILKGGGKVGFTEELYTIRHNRPESISAMNIRRNWDSYCNLRFEILKFISENFSKPLDHDYLQAYFEAIYMYSKVDFKASYSWFNKLVWVNFRLSPSEIIPEMYCRLFNVFCF